MIPDPEERKRVRKEAAKQQAQAAKQRRKVLLGAAAAVLVVVGCIILIASLSGGKKKNVSKEETKPDETRIHLIAGGDLNITDQVVASGGSGYDYTGAFMDVAPILSSGDLAILNFEGTLCGEPFGGEGASAPDNMARALKSAGVDALQLANSYSIRQGISGLHSTVASVRQAGLTPVGVTTNEDERSYVIYDIKGIRVAVVAFTKGMEGDRIPEAGVGCVNLLYTDYDSSYQEVDRKGITQMLDQVAQEKPDITIALLHWGSKGNDKISKTQKEIVEIMQENGVNAIIGTHSHRVQQMELDENGNFVAYSLGDFFGDATEDGARYSVLLDLEIVKDNATGQTRIEGFTYTPIYTVTQEGEPARVVRIDSAIEAYEKGYIDRVPPETYEAMQYALGRIESRIAGEG